MKIKFTQQINNLMLQTSFSILIGHEQWVVTDFAFSEIEINPSRRQLFNWFDFVFVDRNGVPFEKYQAASYLLHLSGYLHWT